MKEEKDLAIDFVLIEQLLEKEEVWYKISIDQIARCIIWSKFRKDNKRYNLLKETAWLFGVKDMGKKNLLFSNFYEKYKHLWNTW